MADFPYMSNYGNLKKFFATIQSGGVPDKVDRKHLEALGFRSSNDRPIIAVLKSVGFIDASGAPTQVWRDYRNKDRARGLLGNAVRSAYAGLFKTYPDADRKDHEALRNYFGTHTKVGELALAQIVRTFQTLCELADFGAAEAPQPRGADAVAEVITRNVELPTNAGALTVNINIQLQMPPTDDATIYEKFFRAMKTHLLS